MDQEGQPIRLRRGPRRQEERQPERRSGESERLFRIPHDLFGRGRSGTIALPRAIARHLGGCVQPTARTSTTGHSTDDRARRRLHRPALRHGAIERQQLADGTELRPDARPVPARHHRHTTAQGRHHPTWHLHAWHINQRRHACQRTDTRPDRDERHEKHRQRTVRRLGRTMGHRLDGRGGIACGVRPIRTGRESQHQRILQRNRPVRQLRRNPHQENRQRRGQDMGLRRQVRHRTRLARRGARQGRHRLQYLRRSGRRLQKGAGTVRQTAGRGEKPHVRHADRQHQRQLRQTILTGRQSQGAGQQNKHGGRQGEGQCGHGRRGH